MCVCVCCVCVCAVRIVSMDRILRFTIIIIIRATRERTTADRKHNHVIHGSTGQGARCRNTRKGPEVKAMQSKISLLASYPRKPPRILCPNRIVVIRLMAITLIEFKALLDLSVCVLTILPLLYYNHRVCLPRMM